MNKVSLLFLFAILASCNNNEAPKLIIKPKLQLRDTVNFGDTQIVRILVVNKGKEEIKLEKILPSCGCTTFNGSINDIIHSNDSLDLIFKYLPEATDSGNIEKSIVFVTNAKPKLYYTSFMVYVKK